MQGGLTLGFRGKILPGPSENLSHHFLADRREGRRIVQKNDRAEKRRPGRRSKGLKFMKRRLAIFLAFPLLMTACGGGSNSSSSAADPPGPLSGNWQVALQSTSSNSDTHPASGFLQQNGDAVTGSVIQMNDPCSGIGGVTGTVTGNNVSLVVSPTGSVVTLTGAINSGGGAMGGTYEITSVGCSSPGIVPDSGNWTANLVAPLSGNIQGTMTSAGQNEGTFTITGSIAQGPYTGISNATLTGTLNVSAGYCFTTASIEGSISGTGVVINLVDSNGNQIGQISGTATLDGKTVTGKFGYLGVATAAKGCRQNDGGPVSFTL
jgi:hypothetical protein